MKGLVLAISPFWCCIDIVRSWEVLVLTGGERALIVGLGNPGPEYADTRHNAGFQCVTRFVERHGLRFSFYRFRASLAEGDICQRRVLVARPLTYMNESGQAVQPLLRHYGIAPDRLLVVYDDLDLPLGKIRLRARGSSGGHKGLDSIIRQTGTTEFPRLRLGIGRPPFGDPIDYVLEDWRPVERQIMDETMDRACEAIDCFLQAGIVAAMNRYNGDEP